LPSTANEEAQPPAVVIDPKAGDPEGGEQLEAVDPDPPEHPSAWR